MTLIWIKFIEKPNEVVNTYEVENVPHVGELLELPNSEFVYIEKIIHHFSADNPMCSGSDIFVTSRWPK